MSNWTRFVKLIIGLRRESGSIPLAALLPLRLFLGITFIYAGLNKFTDPQFFSPTAPNFIGKQMTGYVQSGSPLSPLLTHLAIPHAVFFGAVIALGELWIGISTLIGLFTRLGALGGLITNLIFFLTATWSVYPYFLGGDLPYAAGWLTLMLAGPGLYSLDEYFFGQASHAPHPVAGPDGSGAPSALPSSLAHERMSRAAYLRGLGSAAVLALVATVFAGAAKLVSAETNSSESAEQQSAPGGKSGSAKSGTSSGASASAPASRKKLVNVSSVPRNSAAQYTDPGSGDPALLIHLPSGKFVSYDAICTHAGCTVGYDPNQNLIVCPCHGAVYDPARGAKVLAGPAPYPLKKLQVKINPNGNVYPAS